MRNYKIIGLTGQSGSGKSTVSQIFVNHGFAVVNADKIAREIMQQNSPCTKLIAQYFGEDIIKDNGEINRKKLGKIVFSDKEKLNLLNSITHPFIISKTLEYIKQYSNKNIKYIIFDAPQLFESGADILCDIILAVTASHDVRLKRIANRDKISDSEIKKRFSNQYTEEYFKENCDYTINNDGDLLSLEGEILRFLQLIKTE